VRRVYFAAIAAAVLAADQLTKLAIVRTLEVGESQPLIGEWLRFHHVRNSGASFGLLRGASGLLALVAIAGAAVLAWIIVRDPPWRVGFGASLVAGGALGNLADRIFRPWPFRGTVVDFIDVSWWPTFNVADSAITIGAIMLVLTGVFERRASDDGPDAGDGG
jgi:signal peptidase II